MGDAWKAEDLKLDLQVALKFLALHLVWVVKTPSAIRINNLCRAAARRVTSYVGDVRMPMEFSVGTTLSSARAMQSQGAWNQFAGVRIDQLAKGR